MFWLLIHLFKGNFVSGNGTEDIVRHYAHPSRLFFFSLHLYDKRDAVAAQPGALPYEFFPGSGNRDDMVRVWGVLSLVRFCVI